jgi:hypothetical protein
VLYDKCPPALRGNSWTRGSARSDLPVSHSDRTEPARHAASQAVHPHNLIVSVRSFDIMAEAAIPLLNLFILGSFMAAGVLQLNSLSAAAIKAEAK